MNEQKVYEFADFRLVAHDGLLLRNGELVALPPKVFGVLALLVERHGHLVQKDEFIERIWDGTFVEEGVVTKAVSHARHVLDPAAKEKFIQTVPRRGYRFVAPVSITIDGSGANGLSELQVLQGSAGSTSSSGPPRTNGSLSVPISADTHSNNGSVTGNKYEQLLPAKPRFFNRSRGSFAYAGLGLVLLLALGLYGGLSGRSIGKNYASLNRGTKNDEAYRLYLLANNLMEQRGAGNVQRALEAVDKAVALDRTFARAWAAKAMFHLLDPTLEPAKRYQLSKESVDNAISIDPDLSEAYTVLCYFKIGYEFDFAGGETVCKRAVDLDPDSPRAHRTYAHFLSIRGRFDESVAEARKAIDLEPQSYLNQMDYALVLYYARRFEEEAQWKRLIELSPNDSFNYRRLSRCMARQRRESEAFDYLIKSLTMEGVDNETLERFRATYRASGWRGVAVEEIKLSESRAYNSHRTFNIACLYARLGDKDKAFEYLEKTYQERDDSINELQVEPQLDPLRDDPRYVDLVRRVE